MSHGFRVTMLIIALVVATSMALVSCSPTQRPSESPQAPVRLGPDGLVAYVANTYDQGPGYIEPVCLSNGRIGRRIPVGGQPFVITISPDGNWAYVANSGWDGPKSQSTITPVNLSTAKAGPGIPAGLGPMGIGITPDGSMAYVADMGSFIHGQSSTMLDVDTLTPIDLITRRALKPIVVGPGVGAVAITPDGKSAIVAIDGTESHPLGYVEIVDLETRRIGSPIQVGEAPMGIAITPDGAKALVTDTGFRPLGHTVTPVDLTTGRAGKAIKVGTAPIAIALTPDGSEAFVANAVVGRDRSFASRGTVSTIDVTTDSPGQAITVPGVPQSLAITPDGKTVYEVGMESYGHSALAAIDVATGSVGPSVQLPTNIGAVAVAKAPRGFCGG